MADEYDLKKSEFVCVDYERASHRWSSSGNENGGLLYTTEMQGGASSESWYPTDIEIGCAVCSAPHTVYTHWGKTGGSSCPSGATQLYQGFIAASKYDHSGGGANHLCMHNSAQAPQGASTANHNGALLYGVEYQNMPGLSSVQDRDAGCTVCARSGYSQSYVQWGRMTCDGSGQATEYAGFVMSDHSDHKKSEFICVDPARDGHEYSSSANDNGGLLYLAEFQRTYGRCAKQEPRMRSLQPRCRSLRNAPHVLAFPFLVCTGMRQTKISDASRARLRNLCTRGGAPKPAGNRLQGCTRASWPPHGIITRAAATTSCVCTIHPNLVVATTATVDVFSRSSLPRSIRLHRGSLRNCGGKITKLHVRCAWRLAPCRPTCNGAVTAAQMATRLSRLLTESEPPHPIRVWQL